VKAITKMPFDHSSIAIVNRNLKTATGLCEHGKIKGYKKARAFTRIYCNFGHQQEYLVPAAECMLKLAICFG
jgi:hypothetical protein